MKTLIFLLALTTPLLAEAKKFTITARASEIDKRTKEHPEIDYVFTRTGKPADNQFAMSTASPSVPNLNATNLSNPGNFPT